MTDTRGPDPELFDQDEGLGDDWDETEPALYVEEGRSWKRGLLLALVGLFLSAMLVVAILGVWVARQLDPPGQPGEELTLEIPRGSSVRQIGEILEEHDVAGDATVFRWYVRYKGAGDFDAGVYAFRHNQSMADVIRVLDEGPLRPPTVRITVPEGLTLGRIAAQVERQWEGHTAADVTAVLESGELRSKYQPPEVNTLEGLLLPETFTVSEDESDRHLVDIMIQAMDASLDELGYADAPARVGLSPYQTIVLASLVESEAKVDEERPKIARVIYNRLANAGAFPCPDGRGPCLQIDASTYYALGRQPGDASPGFDRDVDSPYNTYRYPGLPPTPIMAPGRASLAGAIEPEPGPWTYYVVDADDCRRHVFTDNLSEFNRAVEAYRASDCAG